MAPAWFKRRTGVATAGTSEEALIRDRFLRLLELMSGLGLYRSSPKFFIVYAHDNPKLPQYEAKDKISKDYISWFKNLSFDVDSDKSPHGLEPGRGTQIPGASNDILMNQLCLLPNDWDDRVVDYVLVFGSKLLGKYVKDEEDWQPKGEKTLTEKLAEACDGLEKELNELTTVYHGASIVEPRRQWWWKVCQDIAAIRDDYAKRMDSTFHHVLTELALLRLRARCGASSRIIPILLCEDDAESGLADLIGEYPTMLRVHFKQNDPYDQYKKLFSIIKRFEELEDDRPLIEALERCFNECVDFVLAKSWTDPAQCHQECDLITLRTLRQITKSGEYRSVERKITNVALRNILNLHALLDSSSIKSISGEILRGNLSNVDLAIASTALHGDGHHDDPSGIDPLQLRQQQRPQQRQLVAIHDLFQRREVRPKEMLTPHRILIRGLPGSGKSTLSKRILYAYSCDRDLRHLYDYVIRLPLRSLEHTSDLEQLLFEEIFKLVPKGHEFAKQLANLILKHEQDGEPKASKARRVLFILDGLDETRNWPQKEQDLLAKLLNQPDVIILSRFGLGGMTAVDPVDISLEVTGLSNESIRSYLENTAIVSTKDSRDIRQFIASKQAVQDMIRVPIHLDILRFSWDELMQQRVSSQLSTKQEQAPTMTEFYQAIISKLWRKDIVLLAKIENGVGLTEEVINAVRDLQRLLRPVQEEIELLGMIAIKLVHHGRIEFFDRDIDEAIRELEKKRAIHLPLSLESSIPRLSFIRTDSGRGGPRIYSFTHLTFQDFFAAEHLVRNPARLAEQLSEHKYNRRYEVLWRFVAGVLPTSAKLEEFFDLLEQEPRDIVGIRHAHLVMNCLSECNSRLDEIRRKMLQEALSDWLDFEMTLFPAGTIGRSAAFPDDVLLKKLANSKSLTMRQITCIFSQAALSERLCDGLIDRFEHDPRGYKDISKIISDQLFLAPNIVTRLRRMLEGNNAAELRFASEILGRHGELSETAVLDLVDQVALTSGWGSWELLKAQRHLPNTAIERLITMLEQSSKDEAAEILTSQPELPREAVKSLQEGLARGGDHALVYLSVVARQPHFEPQSVENLWNVLIGKGDRLLAVQIIAELARRPAFHEVVLPHLQYVLESASLPDAFELDGIQKFLTAIMISDSSLPSGICSSLARLLEHDNADLRGYALTALRRQTDWIEAEGVPVLSNIFKRKPIDVAMVLDVRIELLVDNPIDWLIENISRYCTSPQELTMENPESSVNSLNEILYYFILKKHGHRPDDNEPWWDKVENAVFNLDGGTGLGVVLRLKPSLKPETLDRLISMLDSWDSICALQGRSDAVEKLLDVLVHTRSQTVPYVVLATVGGCCLADVSPRPAHLVDRLTTLLRDSAALKETREVAARILLSQPQMPATLPRTILEYLPPESSHRIMGWSFQTVEQFACYAECFDESTIDGLLQHYLESPSEENTAAWIEGDCLCWYGLEGSRFRNRLEDEARFRGRFRKAQIRNGLPQWALMKLRSRISWWEFGYVGSSLKD